MPVRKISILRSGYHARGESEKDRKYLDIADVKDGVSYRQILQTAWDSTNYVDLNLKAQDRAVDLIHSKEIGGALLMKGMVGRTGEPGQLRDTVTDELIREDPDGTLTKLSNLRVAYFELDDYPTHAYYVIEQTPNGTLNQALQKIVRNAFKSLNKDLTVDFIAIQNNDQWAETIASLEEIRVIRDRQSLDADSVQEIGVDTLRTQYLARPPRGLSSFTNKAKERILHRKIDIHNLIGIALPGDDEQEAIRVKLGDGQRSKVMDLEDLHGLNYQAIITDVGEQMPEDDKFIEICREHLKDLLGITAAG